MAIFIKLKIQTNISFYKNHKGVVHSVILIFFIDENYRCKLKKIMDDKILFEKDSTTVKNLKYLQKNVFLLYSPRKFTIEPATSEEIDTEVTASLLKNSRRLYYIET